MVVERRAKATGFWKNTIDIPKEPAMTPESAAGESTIEPPCASDQAARPPTYRAAWPWVLCVIGLDYLSTLAYQPSVAFGAAGRLAPLVTVLVAAVTVGFALPIYLYIAGRSPHGGGSTALLERCIPGWFGKLLLLVFLSFGAVDLVFTRTFSAATAAEHITRCPDPSWQQGLDQLTREGDALRQSLPDDVRRMTDGIWNRQTVVSLIVLVIGTALGLMFFSGYTPNFIRLAVVTVVIYLLLTLFIVVCGGIYLARNQNLVQDWWARCLGRELETESRGATAAGLVGIVPGVPAALPGCGAGLERFRADAHGHADGARPPRRHAAASARANPQHPLPADDRGTEHDRVPARIDADHDDPHSSQRTTGRWAGEVSGAGLPRPWRALADGQNASVLSPMMGNLFGTIYDISTVAILTLAGLSFAMTLASWIPPYLQRLGMEFKWSVRLGGLVWLFTALKFAVTIWFGADVDAHRAAYLTGVLAVFAFAALAATVDIWEKRARRHWRRLFRISPLSLLALVVFGWSVLWVATERPIGAVFAGAFIVLVFVISLATRAWRSTEFRFSGFDFADKATEHEWERLKASDFPVLVPYRPGQMTLREREIEVRTRHRIPGTLPIVFVVAELADPSEFQQRPCLRIAREDGRVVIHIMKCCSIAHAIASAALEMSSAGAVPEVHFGWSNENPLTANLHFVLFGHGNVPWMVYTLIRRAKVPEARKPRVVVA